MRKKLVGLESPEIRQAEPQRLDLERVAAVELTSECEGHPIEAALAPGSGWRAGAPGEQRIRLVFDQPQSMRRIRLVFRETEHERTQEFTLRWFAEGETGAREIVRQQYNFSPPATTEEIEEYGVNLDRVKELELGIVPDIGGSDARATLAEVRIG